MSTATLFTKKKLKLSFKQTSEQLILFLFKFIEYVYGIFGTHLVEAIGDSANLNNYRCPYPD